MGLHKNLAGDDLHDPKGKFPSPLALDTNTAQAYRIYEDNTTDAYLVIDTTDSAEEVTVGNTTTNPKLTLAGTGLFTSGGGHKYNVTNVEDGTVAMLASSFVVLVDTSGGTTTYTLADPSTVEGQVFYIIDKVANFATNNFTLTTDSPAELIDGSASDKVISETNARIWLFCDGTSWYTLLDDAVSIPSDIVADTLKINGDTLVANLPGYEDKVGVGTATPGQKFVVEDSATDPHLHVQKTGGNRIDLFATALKSGIQDVSGERISFISGETVVNGDAINLDFRIKGDTDDNLFFANAGTDRIGIGTDSPQRQLHIGDGEDSGEDGIIRLEGYSTSSAYHEIIADGDNLQFTRNTTQQLMLKYDGSVGIGVSNPTTKLDVNGTLKVSGIISGVATPLVGTDAANKTYVDASGGGGLAAVVDDTSPQLGGTLDLNGFSIDVESTEYINISGGAIKATTGYGVHDEANNEQLLFTKTSSAVDYFNITNSAAGGSSLVATSTAPLFEASGSDTNIDMGLMCKGTGAVTVRANANSGSAAQSGVLRINAESNTKSVNLTVPLNDALTSYTLTLPVDAGLVNQVMETNGSGVLSWVTPSASGLTYQNKTATFSAAVDYFYTVDSSGGDVTVTLPAVGTAGNAGKTIDVCHKVIGNNIIFSGDDGETINGALTLTVGGTAYQNITLFCTGSEWLVR